jgi:hypothetical protein
MDHTIRSVPPIAMVALALATLIVALVAATSSASAASWLPHSLNFPPGVTQEKLIGVGCSSSTSCTAGGQDYNGTWGAHAESGWGSGWAFQTGVTRNPGGWANSVLNGSNCVAATTFCMTVGSQGTSGGTPASMAQRKSGSTWTFYNTGVPAGATMSEFNSVSCLSASWCMAAGWKMVSGTGRPFAMGFNGSSWSDTGAVATSDSVMRGISCASTSYCVAVGYTGGTAVAQVWTGFSWAATPAVAVPAGGSNYILNSISCVSATWCMAVGTYHVSGGTTGDRPMSAVWNGSTWTSKPNLPWGFATGGRAYGVSCLSTTVCHAVGETDTTMPLADVWNGTTWSQLSTPLAPGATNAVLRGISCVSTTRCEASGWSLFGGTPTGLIQTYS